MDIEDEFLALAGGDSDDGEPEQEQAIDDGRQGSGSPDPDDDTTKPKPSSAKDDGDAEEGEASSVGSPGSQQSAPMDESDSDNEAPAPSNSNGKVADDDATSYPYEGIYASEAEKYEIQAMPELEREQLLAKRQEEVDRQRQNNLLRALLKNREDDSQPGRKRKASDADADDAHRKTSRQRTKIGGSKVGETNTGIESLRRARAEKIDRQRRREEDRERGKDRSISFARNSMDRDDDDSDVDWRDGRDRPSRSRSPEVKEIPLAELRDFERIRLGRTRFGEVCFSPGFEEAITGCYVRIAVGPDAETGVPLYRLALVKGFVQGKPYAMEKQNRQTFITDQYIKAAHGKAEKEWPFISCSDSPITDSEFRRYKAVCQNENVIFPKQPTLLAKIDDINNLRNRSWTDAEINQKIEREMSLRKKYQPNDRERLQKSLAEAQRKGDEAKVAELEDQLASASVPRLAFKTSLTNKNSGPATPSQQDRLAHVNAENRRKNAEAVRRAQMQERAKTKKIQAMIDRGEDPDDDPSRRLKPKPKFMHDVNAKNEQKPKESPKATPDRAAKPEGKNQVLPHIAKLHLQNQELNKDKGGMPQIHRPLVEDDIIASMDLDIDVEID